MPKPRGRTARRVPGTGSLVGEGSWQRRGGCPGPISRRRMPEVAASSCWLPARGGCDTRPAAARWRASCVGPGGRSHVTPGTAAASQSTCPREPCGATRRLAPSAPHQLVGAGPQLGFILHFGSGFILTRDREVSARMSKSGRWGHPRELPKSPRAQSPSLQPEPAVSMETATGALRPGVAPLTAQAQFATRQEPGGTPGGEPATARGP